ncbi:hypothetical protein SELMODRAFT_31776, partial [Selaginella moellendorffii]
SNTTLEAYARCGGLAEALHLFHSIHRPNLFSWGLVIRACIGHDRLPLARKFFDGSPQRGLVLWTTMVAAYAQAGDPAAAQELFESMPEWDVISSTVMITACELPRAREIFADMPERNLVSWTAMAVAYARRGHLEEAVELLDRMPELDLVLCTSIAAAHARSGDFDRAREFFNRIKEPDAFSYATMIAAHAQAGKMEEAQELFDRMPEFGVVAATALVHGYAESGDLEAAKLAFDRMPEKNIVSWTTIVSAYARAGLIEAAEEFFASSMSEHDTTSSNAMLAALTLNSCVDRAKAVFDAMPLRDLVSWNSICEAFAGSNRVDVAAEIFRSMPETDVVSWTTLVVAYAQAGHSAAASLELFHAMNLHGQLPNAVTFVGILTACSRIGSLRIGLACFASMVHDFALEVSPEHWSCLVDMLGRSGQTSDAQEVIKDLPAAREDPVAWTAFLSSCKDQADFQRGAFVARDVVASGVADGGAFTLVSSI